MRMNSSLVAQLATRPQRPCQKVQVTVCCFILRNDGGRSLLSIVFESSLLSSKLVHFLSGCA